MLLLPLAEVLFTLASLARRRRGTQVFPGPARCLSSLAELQVLADNFLFIIRGRGESG